MRELEIFEDLDVNFKLAKHYKKKAFERHTDAARQREELKAAA